MKIIKIEELSKTKCRVVLEDNMFLVLYKADIRRYKLAEGVELQNKQINLFWDELLPYRAKNRCMKLLQSRDYTEKEIRKKLQADGYPESIINDTVQYLYGYHYLDDKRYVKLYYQSRKHRKSKTQIIYDLQQKGISKEMIMEILEQYLQEDEENGDIFCIRKFLMKKKYDDNMFTYDEKEKIKASLYRKGFQLNDINHCMHNFCWEKL